MSDDPDGRMRAATVTATARQMSPDEIRRWRSELQSSLSMWHEDDGALVPTEPDPDERKRVRDCLRAAIQTIDRVLGDEQQRRVDVHG